MNSLRLLFVLHDHQPIGNFDHVFEQAYQDSYRPFLDLLDQYPQLRVGLHTSGPLMEWLDAHHPEYLDRLARYVAANRIEIIGGAFYEPILSMISPRDRVGQIRTFREWLETRLGATVRGMWIPERVWEQSMTGDLIEAGVDYIILDDSHFKNAGLRPDQLHGYYLTEDDGRTLRVLPGSEPLRYIIPFGAVYQAIDYLRDLSHRAPGCAALFADDGEKFGVWPDTGHTVQPGGWLAQLFEQFAQNPWIQLTLPSELIDSVPPQGTVYLPEGSYREMTEWVLPPEQLIQYEGARASLRDDPRWPTLSHFMRGGFWRNFKVRYPEANEMYARMMLISKRLQEAVANGADQGLIRQARTELYRGQCNCPYWHGAFGGIYLPHLRNAIYEHLIQAENLLDQAENRRHPWVEATSDDYNFDGRPEVRLANDKLLALIAPARGGQIYELDVRAIRHNLLATLTRRPEAYHQRVLAGPNAAGGSVIDANAPVKFKQAGLEHRVTQYDAYERKSLLDHFYDDDVSLTTIAASQAMERGDFLHGGYEAKIRRNPGRIQVQMTRAGNAWGVPLRITKGITLEAGHSAFEIGYLIEGLPPGRTFHFAVEFNFAGLPGGASDRYFLDASRQRLGDLGTSLDLRQQTELSLVDEWLGIDVGLAFSQPTHLWTYPVQTVSQSEGGFELVHQSVAVVPHWHVTGDAQGKWSITLRLTADTALAEAHQPAASMVGVG
ncbi:MAG: alpha-amylase/4-alpha-glucanotransferase domain-containing protein [Pirellulales bacterium]|nr:alpha-amylase/4-alpha-glucanotransferase domain-containing protein [Pirellulales bacterium]